MSQAGKDVVMGLFGAINGRRLDALGEYMASDVVDYNKIIHGEADEPGAAFDGIRQQLAAFDPFHVRVDQLVAEADTAVARTTMNGAHTGTHPRMPSPTRRSFEVGAIWWFTIAGGKITEIRAVSDRLGLFLQLRWDWPALD